MSPAIHAMPWGGSRIHDVLGKTIPPELAGSPIGESWEVSAHAGGVSRVANGPLAGSPLDEVAAAWGERLVGPRVADRHCGAFPMIVKLIEVNALASVQVHPDEVHAMRAERCPFGKSEAWYIIDAAPRAEAYLGLRPGVDRERLRGAIEAGTVPGLLERPTLRAGDCVLLESGTVHACGNGILLLEVQQSCDITYRIHDWGRGRELHVAQALEVIDVGARPRVARSDGRHDEPEELLRGRDFRVFEVKLARGCRIETGDAFATLTVVGGRCSLDSADGSLDLRGGDTVLVPAGLAVTLEGAGATIVGAAPVG
jgi:mannose-6-phosphate isomerase